MAAEAQAEDSVTQQVADLFDQYHKPIFAYLFRLVNDWDLAHDLTQEAFLRLLRTADQLPTIENPRAFTYRIATNLAYNTLKRRRRFTWLPWRRVDERQTALEDPAKRIQEQNDVAQLLAALPVDYRIPLLLYSYDGLSVREVAAVLNLSEGAVKTRLFRAREMFRRAHEEEVNDESS